MLCFHFQQLVDSFYFGVFLMRCPVCSWLAKSKHAADKSAPLLRALRVPPAGSSNSESHLAAISDALTHAKPTRKGPSTNIMRTLGFFYGILNMVWAKYSLFEALDPLGNNSEVVRRRDSPESSLCIVLRKSPGSHFPTAPQVQGNQQMQPPMQPATCPQAADHRTGPRPQP